MKNNITYLERIKNLSIKNDLTQEQLADYLHINQNTYSRYESGVLNCPLDIIIKLADFYNTSIDYIAEITDFTAQGIPFGCLWLSFFWYR